MRTLLQNINEIDNLIRQLQKIASRIRSGENVDAWRECNGLIADVTKSKHGVIQDAADDLLQNINELDYLLRQLQKLASRIRSGENVDGWGECNALIRHIMNAKTNLIRKSVGQDSKDAE